jgi:SIR2-like domain
MQLQFNEILPLLTSAYESGRLVPFLGAGMSAPSCAQWDVFVSNLERIAKINGQAPLNPSSPKPTGNLAARADRSVAILRNQGRTEELWNKLREALRSSAPMTVPRQTEKLARIYWPLIVTTNYDDLFLKAAAEAEAATARRKLDGAGIMQLTRHPWHCKEVMNSLVEPSGRYVWHIQGFLGGQADPDSTPEALAKRKREGSTRRVPFQRFLDDLVVGHGEYRRVTNLEPQFRRCFAEVFRQRSFLFLGSSLSEEYFLNLFGEILEICGPNPWPHFAFAKQGETDARFLLERMNISVCEYPDHDELPNMLGELEKSINGRRCRPASWSFRLNESRYAMEPEGSRQARLTIRRNSLPKLPTDGPERKDCVAVSVGRQGSYARFSKSIREYLKDAIPNFPAVRTNLQVPEHQYTA